LRIFVFVKPEPNRELEVAMRLKALSNVNRVYLILGEFDSKGLTSLKEIGEMIFSEVRELEHVVDTTTFMPVNSVSKETFGEVASVFVLFRVTSGRAREVRRRLKWLPEVEGVHLVFGEAYVFMQLRVDKLSTSSRQRISSIVNEKLVSIKWVSNSDTLPLISEEWMGENGLLSKRAKLEARENLDLLPELVKGCLIEK
jgi:hypothetical protein